MTIPEAPPSPVAPITPAQAVLPAPAKGPAGIAVAALVVGIVAFVSGLAPVWGLLAGGTAVVLGAIALAKRQSKVLAWIGVGLGVLAVLASLLTTSALVIGIANGGGSDAAANSKTNTEINTAPSPTEATEPAEAPAKPIEEAPAEPKATVSQANAERSAEQYLDYTAFSRTGLIKQLEYEGFSTEDATYGVDAVQADWNAQAADSAQAYLDYTAFSRSGLIDQLIYEGFSSEEAEFGVTAVGL